MTIAEDEKRGKNRLKCNLIKLAIPFFPNMLLVVSFIMSRAKVLSEKEEHSLLFLPSAR